MDKGANRHKFYKGLCSQTNIYEGKTHRIRSKHQPTKTQMCGYATSTNTVGSTTADNINPQKMSSSALNDALLEIYGGNNPKSLIHCANKQMHGDIELQCQRRMKCADDTHVASPPQAAEEVRRRKCRDCLTPPTTKQSNLILLKSLFHCLLSWRRKILSHLHILWLQIFGKEVSVRKWEEMSHRPTTEQSTAIFFLVCPVHRISETAQTNCICLFPQLIRLTT